MKNFLLLLFLITLTQLGYSQGKTELGVHLGVSYYQGDINKAKVFYSPSMSYGVILKYNLSKYLSVRGEGIYAKLKGSDFDFTNTENVLRKASFSASLIDLSGVIEFNFLPYNSSGFTKRNAERFAPYIFVGIGANFSISSEGFEKLAPIPTKM